MEYNRSFPSQTQPSTSLASLSLQDGDEQSDTRLRVRPPGKLDREQKRELEAHKALLSGKAKDRHSSADDAGPHKLVPIFTGATLTALPPKTFAQYGLLGERFQNEADPRLLMHTSPPWSTFICGSQGSGKSHTLSCMLENCLHSSKASKLEHPLAGMVFHWDRFTSYGSSQICEAAYLCSVGIPVRVFVSPSNLKNMKATYSNLPNLPTGAPTPVVVPLLFDESQLDVSKMMTMMGFGERQNDLPLYMQVCGSFSCNVL